MTGHIQADVQCLNSSVLSGHSFPLSGNRNRTSHRCEPSRGRQAVLLSRCSCGRIPDGDESSGLRNQLLKGRLCHKQRSPWGRKNLGLERIKTSFRCYWEKAMAPHSSTLAWKIPWMEEPGGPKSVGSLRVRQDSGTSLSLFTFLHWRRQWQPTPVFLPGESQGQGSLVGCQLWGRTESDTTEAT